MKYNLIILLFFLGTVSLYANELENALKQAGNNRAELEKVLTHYGNNPADSQKLRAAEFLIANMPGHWSYDADRLNDYYTLTNHILHAKFSIPEKAKQLVEFSETHPLPSIKRIEDVQMITADYLIQNIELAFATWKNAPWARHLTFDEFCEYLLPYKVTEGQPFDNWRTVLYQQYAPLLEGAANNQYYRNSASSVASIIVKTMQVQMKPTISSTYKGLPLLAADNINKIPIGDCTDYGVAVTAVLRSLGIPVVMEFVPQWSYRSDWHLWNRLSDALRNHITFDGLDGLVVFRPYAKLGKVYQRTYAINPNLQKLQQAEQVPSVFQNVFLKDVTADYCPVANALVEVIPQKRKMNKSAYLSVFNNHDWIPVALSEKENTKVHFANLGKDIVYLPVYATENGVESFNYPFLLEHSGNVKYFVPDTKKYRTITVNRKYPVFTKTFDAALRIVNARIQVSNDKDFQNAITIHSVDKWESSGSIIVSDTLSAYRYWRFCLPYPKDSYLAELMFFRLNEETPYQGKIIGTEQTNLAYSRERAFDNDPFTFFQGNDPKSAWVGMDFGEPTKINKIIYLPRSDDNNIRIGDVYELFYWSQDGWQSLGGQQATDITLTFNELPDNALLWLRDLTRGKEERIFTYENGKQIWW